MISDEKATQALTALTAVMKDKQRKELWNEGEKLFAQVNMHRIPSFPREREVRKLVVLENELWSPDTSICLLTKDYGATQEDTVDEVKKLLHTAGITRISKILPFEELKKEFKGFELKRQLAKNYDVFIADAAVTRLARAHLGKEFYTRRKIPFNVDLSKTKCLARQFEMLSKTTQVILTSKGANINISFAHSLMTEEAKRENLNTLLQKLPEIVPRGFKNVKMIALQGTDTMSIPVYRNDVADASVDEMSGLELERRSAYDQEMELRAEIKPKWVKPMKTKKRRSKTTKAKRKLLVVDAPDATAKKAKIES